MRLPEGDFDQRLGSPWPVRGIIAKPQPRCARMTGLRAEVFHNQLDPVPTAKWLSAIRHRPPSRAGLPAQQTAQRDRV